MEEIRIHKWRIRLPESRFWRIVIGVLLIIGGLFGFLPVLGFWMIPLGLAILSFEFPLIRRWRRRAVVWLARTRRRKERQPPTQGKRKAAPVSTSRESAPRPNGNRQ